MQPVTPGQKVSAWSVHALTLSGLLWAALAVIALVDQQTKLMWLFLFIALLTDAVDGPLARKFQVKRITPNFDGGLLDVVIDYLTWSFIPAFFLYSEGYLGAGFWGTTLFVLILVSSMFCYANVRVKTSEWYFVGFPAAWNVVAVYFYLLNAPVLFNQLVTGLFAVITLLPLTFLHPFRVRRLRLANTVATAVWLVTTVALVAVAPAMPLWLAIVWWTSGAWIILSGLLGVKGIGAAPQDPSPGDSPALTASPGKP